MKSALLFLSLMMSSVFAQAANFKCDLVQNSTGLVIVSADTKTATQPRFFTVDEQAYKFTVKQSHVLFTEYSNKTLTATVEAINENGQALNTVVGRRALPSAQLPDIFRFVSAPFTIACEQI